MKKSKKILNLSFLLFLFLIIGFTTQKQAMIHPPSDGNSIGFYLDDKGNIHLTTYILDYKTKELSDFLLENCTLLETKNFENNSTTITFSGDGKNQDILIFSDKKELISYYIALDNQYHISGSNISGGIRFNTKNNENFIVTLDSENYLENLTDENGDNVIRIPSNHTPFYEDSLDPTFYMYKINKNTS